MLVAARSFARLRNSSSDCGCASGVTAEYGTCFGLSCYGIHGIDSRHPTSRRRMLAPPRAAWKVSSLNELSMDVRLEQLADVVMLLQGRVCALVTARPPGASRTHITSCSAAGARSPFLA